MSSYVGCRVRALARVEEEGFSSKDFAHAEKGDLGRILARDGDWLTVSWDRQNTVTDCHVSEIELVATLDEPKPSAPALRAVS